jgi:hypothetical protein
MVDVGLWQDGLARPEGSARKRWAHVRGCCTGWPASWKDQCVDQLFCGPGEAGAPDREAASRLASGQEDVVSRKPAAEDLGIDVGSLNWRRPAGAGSEDDAGTLEVAMARTDAGSTLVLLRVAGDPAGRVLVYDEHEWDCFLDGVRNGEFDVPR